MLAVLALLQSASAGDAARAYAGGVQALRRHDAPAAERSLRACVRESPEDSECWWELGWALWLEADWPGVVDAWERVERLDPGRDELADRLEQARAQLRSERLAHSLREGAPEGPAHAPPGASLRVRAAGDVMLGTSFPPGHLPPDGGAGLLDAVAPILADADLSFVNLEGPLCDGGSTRKCAPGAENCYAFRVPTSYGPLLLQAGIDVVSTANNHAGDFGEACRRETERTLDSLGIGWSGPPGTFAELHPGDLRVALVAFHSSPAVNDLNRIDAAAELVGGLAAGHDVVIVSFHGGAEGAGAEHVPAGHELFHGEDRGDLRSFTHRVVDAGADLVLGHGPHVPRGMEVYRGRLIAYSLGNFATYDRFNLSGDLGAGMVLEAVLDGEGRFLRGRIIPTRQRGRGVPEPDPGARATDLVRLLSAQDFPDTAVTVARDGQLLPPGTQ